MLLVEDVLLLLTDDATGKAAVDSSTLDLALAGAVLLELAAQGRADVAGPGEQVKAGRVVVRDASPLGDPLLDAAIASIANSSPRKPDSMLGVLKKGLAAEVRHRLVTRGILRHEEGRILGIFPTNRWPAEDSNHEDMVRRALHDVLVTGRTATPTEAGIVAILLAVDKVHAVVVDTALSRRDLKARAKAIAEGGFASEAVRKAIEAINAAVMTSIMAATAAGAAASG
ncbi:MAG: GPP34 family phosphoprotein [Actinomycetales bacterium]|nr:GPP34 family phosphoprotein [Actinomycetales bacterium]